LWENGVSRGWPKGKKFHENQDYVRIEKPDLSSLVRKFGDVFFKQQLLAVGVVGCRDRLVGG
jgi:hypothetical protein